MKSRSAWLALAVALAVAAPALAGGSGHKCTKTTQACLDEMAATYRTRGWAGLELDKTDGGHLIKAVVAGSPAEAAGLKAGDVLVAINGIRFAEENKEALYRVKKTLTPGASVSYTVKRAGAEKQVAFTLAAPPEEVVAAWVGEHMLEHAEAKKAVGAAGN